MENQNWLKCLTCLESSMRLFTDILFVVAQGAGVLNIEDSKQSGSKQKYSKSYEVFNQSNCSICDNKAIAVVGLPNQEQFQDLCPPWGKGQGLEYYRFTILLYGHCCVQSNGGKGYLGDLVTKGYQGDGVMHKILIASLKETYMCTYPQSFEVQQSWFVLLWFHMFKSTLRSVRKNVYTESLHGIYRSEICQRYV